MLIDAIRVISDDTNDRRRLTGDGYDTSRRQPKGLRPPLA
jgi:hypothetical protein